MKNEHSRASLVAKRLVRIETSNELPCAAKVAVEN